jgi:hypothetical protein
VAVTVNINGLTLCHKGSGGISHNTLPDVCKTPPFGIPAAYKNEAYSADLVKGTTSVFDEPGSMGGILSGTYKAETDWITHSFDVLFEGKRACRLTDKLFMNHGNTVNMAGLIQTSLPPAPDVDDDFFFHSAFPEQPEVTPSSDSSETPDTEAPPPPPAPKKYKPVIRLQDAPGINGLPLTTKNWHIVIAASYLQAVTTDQCVMTGTSDDSGYLFNTKEQELMRLHQLTPSRLWLVVGNRAYKISFYQIGIEQPLATRDYYAQDTMGYHRKFNQVITSCPGDELWKCVRRESGVTGSNSLLDLVAGEK